MADPNVNLKSTVQSQMVAAMKAGDKNRTQVLRMVLSEIKRKEFDDVDARPLDAVAAYAKTLRKAMADMEKHGAAAQVTQLQSEIAIVEEFLPKAIEDAALAKLAADALGALGPLTPRDTGRAIGAVMKAVAATGQSVDPGKVRALVESKMQP